MKLYLHFFSIHLRSAFQYKVSFFLTAIGQFLVSFNVFLGVYFMFYRFHEVNGYQFDEVLLCFSITLMAYTLAEAFIRGFDTFASTIAHGEFDRILLRPRHEIFLVLANKIEFTRIGRLLQAIIILIYAIIKIEIEWNISKVVTLILMLIGGSVVFGCLFIIYASICFFTLEGLEFMNILTDGAREFGKYPLSIYGKNVLRFCTFLVPYALFQYYPFLYLTGRSQNQIYMIFPLIACLFFFPTYLFWCFGVKHYKSTGS